MKNLLFFLALLPSFIKAQNDCRGYSGDAIFQANKIGALFHPNGSKFVTDRDKPLDGYFKVPYTSENSPSTIFASAPWIGGFKNGELKLAGTSFGYLRQDYYPGPVGPAASTYPGLCNYFDHIWSVNAGEIEAHILDASDGSIEDTIPAIFGWPAQGNIYFDQFNAFALPPDHNGGWADYDDLNANDIYEPQLGEYPRIRLKGVSYIPDQIMWMVFNDQGIHEQSNGDPLGVEIQLTVYGFNCQNNSVLNTTLFNTYKIINQDAISLDSVYFGMWTDYDLGCSYDDYVGSDSLRSTEFIYNDEIDGEWDGDCVTGAETYALYPPVQSMTYLSPRMHSFIADGLHPANNDNITPEFPKESYTLLTGKWIDGTPITLAGNGYNPGNPGGATHFLYNGNPNDTLQWSMYKEFVSFGDPRPVSSVYLSTLQPNESVIVETAYTFHQDSSLNHLEQVGFMYSNIDSLWSIVNDSNLTCVRFPFCMDRDCVWPGDFNHNGIADHFDLLYWGVMKDSLGTKRNGRINWDGHFADPWSLTLPNGLNAKHGDGNGNSIVNAEDLERNINHYLFTNPYYQKEDHYPEGPEIVLSSNSMNSTGGIRGIEVRTGILLENVLGLAYELEYDTALYYLDPIRIPKCPVDSNIICLHTDAYAPVDPYFETSPRYGFVKTDHQAISIEQDFLLDRIFGGLRLREEVTLADIPDTVIIRLKNLIALDAQGNDLHIGSGPLAVPKYQTVGYQDPIFSETVVIPNPTNGFISVQTEVETEAQLYSLHGQMVRHISKNEIESPVDVSNLVPGIYILRILATGESIKLIIQ